MEGRQDLRAEFEAELYALAREAPALNYRPTLFLKMLADHGGVETAQRLLAADAPQYSLLKLRQMERLDLSLEARVIHPRFRELFLRREIAVAEERLRGFGYGVPSE